MAIKEEERPVQGVDDQISDIIVALIKVVVAVLAILFLPVDVVFWIAVIFPAIGLYSYIEYSFKRTGVITVREKVSEEGSRVTFSVLAVLCSIVAAAVTSGLLYVFSDTLPTWNYALTIVASLSWFLLGMMFWRLSSPRFKIYKDTITRGVSYSMAVKAVAHAVLVQYAFTEYFLDANTPGSLLIVIIVTLPVVLYYRASLLYNILGHHASDRW